MKKGKKKWLMLGAALTAALLQVADTGALGAAPQAVVRLVGALLAVPPEQATAS